MRRSLRLFACWLLLATVPMHGVLAASMLACGAGHQGIAKSREHRAHDQHAAGHAVSGASEHAHHSAAKSSGPIAGESIDDGKVAGAAVQGTCSVCAACCVGAAAVSRPIVFEPLALPDFYASFAERRVAAFENEGLERPPRPFLL